jgi:hypothetical protein
VGFYSQPQTTTEKQGKGTEQAGEHTTSRQNKGKGEGESTETNPGRQKSKSAKQNRQQSKITQQQDN